MISVIGLGTGASKIASLYSRLPQYNAYEMNSSISRNSKNKFALKSFNSPEEYENNIPNVSKFFKDLDHEVQFFVVGSSYSSNYSLGIIEQIKDKKIDLFYIKPDTELLAGIPRLVESATYGVLQEYARSGLLNSINLISKLNVESVLGNVPIKGYYETLNSAIQNSCHYIDYFERSEPEIGLITKPSEICRIKTYGMLDMETLEEKWFFNLDTYREICYYLCINEERLRTDGTLHKKYVKLLKNKPRNAFINISYAIYETESEQDFGFCVARTNAVQKNS